MEFKLTKNQQAAYNLVHDTNYNVAIIGKPGVGKSVLINALRKASQEKVYVLGAPTGLAALNIKGRTIHSIFRIPISQGIIHPSYDKYPTDSKVVNMIKHYVNHLVIDEISMVRADIFDYIDRCLQYCKGNNLPFGGAQVIIVGDFFQLPPIVKTDEKIQLREAGYNSEFTFDSFAFKRGDFKIVLLEEVLRQKGDPTFIEILHRARTGHPTGSDLRTLNKLVGLPKDLRIKLASRNQDADDTNKSEMKKLPEPDFHFTAQKFGHWDALPVEEDLVLRKGAQVMVKKNGADKPDDFRGEFHSKVVNGTLAIVEEIIPSAAEADEGEKVKIKLENGEIITIYRKRWERKIKEKVGDKWEERVIASYEQLPLVPAWSISIHKSQGQTFDKVHINANRIFAPGQLYVALSRCKSLQGLSFEQPLYPRQFFANLTVVDFHNELKPYKAPRKKKQTV